MVEVALFTFLAEKYLSENTERRQSKEIISRIEEYVHHATMNMRTTSLTTAIAAVEKQIQEENGAPEEFLDDLNTNLKASRDLYQQYKKILALVKDKLLTEIRESRIYKDDPKVQILLSTYQLYRQLRKDFLHKLERNLLETITQIINACQALQTVLTKQTDLQPRVNLIISTSARLRELISIESYRVKGRGMIRETRDENDNNNSVPSHEENQTFLIRISDLTEQETNLKLDGKELDFIAICKKLAQLESSLQAVTTQLTMQKHTLTLFSDNSEKLNAVLTLLLDINSGLMPAFVDTLGKINLVLGIHNLKDWVDSNKPSPSQTKISVPGQYH
jgi:hypothetical protein